MDSPIGRLRHAFALSLAILFSLNSHLAHAAVANALSPNQAVTGTVTGSSTYNYSFNVADNKSFVVVLTETGVHDQYFLPRLAVSGPDHSGLDLAVPYYREYFQPSPANGSWNVMVGRGDRENSSGGSFALTLIQAPITGARALTSTPQAGSNDKSKIDAWTFTGTVGHKVTVNLVTTGDKTFAPPLFLFSPSGALVSAPHCTAGCGIDVNPTESGTWTIAASNATENGAAGSYTLSITDAN